MQQSTKQIWQQSYYICR